MPSDFDSISYLVECGQSLDEIRRLIGEGISVDEQVEAVRSIEERGQPPGSDLDPCGDIQNILHQLKPEENYKWNEQGIGRLFADVFKNEARFNVTAKEWYSYNGKIWEKDNGGMRVAQKAKLLADALLIYCITIKDERQREGFTKFAMQYGKFRNRKTMIEDAKSEYFISNDDLDRDGFLFNCINGVFNLDTFELLPHKPEYLLSRISNVFYNPDADPEQIERFVSQVMCENEHKIDYLQRIHGYSLTTDTSLECAFIDYGESTRNGKSTWLETYGYMMGGSNGYAVSVSPETLSQRKNRDSRTASGDIARLAGARFLHMSEPPRKMLLDVALLKTWTGNDTIVCRKLFESEMEFKPVFHLFINTNFLPVVTDETLFTSNRINVITFDRHFQAEEQDRGLKARLQSPENISALFNWCLEGLRKYRKSGAEPPDAVKNTNEQYRRKSDKVTMFFDECMEPADTNIGAGTVYQSYANWCSANGYGMDSKSSFFDSLKTKGWYAASGTVNGRTVRNIIRGYQLIDDGPPPPEEPPPYIHDIRGGIGY